MTLKYLFLGCLLIASLGLMIFSAGCQEAAELGELACEGMEGSDRDHCLQQVAVASNNISICEKIDAAGPKSKCWIYIASNVKQPQTCFGMADQSWYGKQGAYDKQECLQYVAKEIRDPDVCFDIEENYIDQFGSDLNPGGVSRDLCYASVMCGKKGLPSCYDWEHQTYYCEAPEMPGGRKSAGSGTTC